jgi:hypothetical protein
VNALVWLLAVEVVCISEPPIHVVCLGPLVQVGEEGLLGWLVDGLSRLLNEVLRVFLYLALLLVVLLVFITAVVAFAGLTTEGLVDNVCLALLLVLLDSLVDQRLHEILVLSSF